MRSNLITLMALKSAKEQRRITTNVVAAELKDKGVSRNSVYAFASDGMKEFPQKMLLAMMEYFDCDLDKLFIVEEVAEVTE